MKTLPWLCTAVVLSSLPGCQGTPDKVYDIKGKVTAINVEEKKITLDHEAIPGFMKAMEMPFDLEDLKVVEKIKAGDQVEGKLKVAQGKNIITELRKR